jgi:hypothetical protein
MARDIAHVTRESLFLEADLKHGEPGRLTRGWPKELGAFCITVNAVAPGPSSFMTRQVRPAATPPRAPWQSWFQGWRRWARCRSSLTATFRACCLRSIILPVNLALMKDSRYDGRSLTTKSARKRSTLSKPVTVPRTGRFAFDLGA